MKLKAFDRQNGINKTFYSKTERGIKKKISQAFPDSKCIYVYDLKGNEYFRKVGNEFWEDLRFRW